MLLDFSIRYDSYESTIIIRSTIVSQLWAFKVPFFYIFSYEEKFGILKKLNTALSIILFFNGTSSLNSSHISLILIKNIQILEIEGKINLEMDTVLLLLSKFQFYMKMSKKHSLCCEIF